MDWALEWKLGRKIKLSIGHRNTSCRHTSQYYRAWGIFCMLQSICKSMSNNIGPKTSEEMSHPNQDEGEGVIWQWLEVIRICSCQARKWQCRILRETDIVSIWRTSKWIKRVSEVANGVMVSIAYITGYAWDQRVKTYQEDFIVGSRTTTYTSGPWSIKWDKLINPNYPIVPLWYGQNGEDCKGPAFDLVSHGLW